MNILLDAFGGDNAPDEVIKGAVKAINEVEADITLIGNEQVINERVKQLYEKNNIKEISQRISIYNSTQVITNDELPTKAIKSSYGYHIIYKDGA